MKKFETIFEEGDHSWAVIARDPEKPGYLIDTNEYVIRSGDQALLTDPGGMEIFPVVFATLGQHINPDHIRYIFASHQDPDIISSLNLWLEVKPEIKCYLSWLWNTFVPHFGGDNNTFIDIDDKGMDISLGNIKLRAVPAHYLHSSGNFHLYDPVAKILFTGDVGAALLPEGESNELYVSDFQEHIRFMEGFHRRWMGSNEARRNWCNTVANMDIDMICPQHGSIFRGPDVERFITWFSELQVGIY
ncbi:MAG: MBL fold metallo-hydrolase [Leptospiraceae bacterium]|nr:MBL fold metallo-hydrolase [Leptospiraceae bacterium]